MPPYSLVSAARGACLSALALMAAAHPTTPGIASQEPTTPASAKIVLALAPQDATLLSRTVHDISNPRHRRYGQHLSHDEALDLLKPHPDSVSAVKAWLRGSGIHDGDIRYFGQYMHVTVTSTNARTLLKRAQSAANPYAISEAVSKHLRSIRVERAEPYPPPENKWHPYYTKATAPVPPPQHPGGYGTTGNPLAGCNDRLTPDCLRVKYQMTDLRPTEKKTILGVVGFSGQTAQHSDLELFFKTIDPSHAASNFTDQFLNGGINPQGNNHPNGEANLDMQWAVAIAAENVDVRFLSVGGKNTDFIPDLDLPSGPDSYTEPYFAFADALAALPDADLPSVISISYGVNEQLLAKPCAQHVCDVFGQLSTRGVSVLVASGDGGPGRSCQSNDGSKRTRFLPSFPASCPYVTAVGATVGAEGEESAADFSGGGFSEYFPRPDYQNGPVNQYAARNAEKWKGLFNPDGRGIPDVSALGKNYMSYFHGQSEAVDGTSASTPVVAAMIAILNSLRAQKGKRPLGFLNYWFYQSGRWGFKDVTKGVTEGCPGTSYSGLASPKVDGAGWAAGPGWDAATGWGTPLFGQLRLVACL